MPKQITFQVAISTHGETARYWHIIARAEGARDWVYERGIFVLPGVVRPSISRHPGDSACYPELLERESTLIAEILLQLDMMLVAPSWHWRTALPSLSAKV
jgi:hypothetical protein